MSRRRTQRGEASVLNNGSETKYTYKKQEYVMDQKENENWGGGRGRRGSETEYETFAGSVKRDELERS